MSKETPNHPSATPVTFDTGVVNDPECTMLIVAPDVPLFAAALLPEWSSVAAGSLQEAKEFLDGTAVPVVLCDRDWDGVSWTQAVSELSEHRARPCVIVLTRSADHSVWDETADLGGYDVLPKPVDPGALRRALVGARNLWRTRRLAAGAEPQGVA